MTLFSSKRQKDDRFRWEGRWRETEWSRKKRNHNQNISHEKNLFLIKEKKMHSVNVTSMKLTVPSMCPLVWFGRGHGVGPEIQDLIIY